MKRKLAITRLFFLILLVLCLNGYHGQAQTPLNKFVCPTSASSFYTNNDYWAGGSDGICNSGTEMRARILAPLEWQPYLRSLPIVTRLDNGPHRASLSLDWKTNAPPVVMTIIVEWRKRVHTGWGSCSWRGWEPLYVYKITRNYVQPGGEAQITGTTVLYAPTDETVSTFNKLNFTPTITEKDVTVTKIKYFNGVQNVETDVQRYSDGSYKPTPITYSATGRGSFNLSVKAVMSYTGSCTYESAPFVKTLKVHSSCFLDDLSNVVVNVNGAGVKAHADGSFGVDKNVQYTVNVTGITDFNNHFTWNFSDFGQDVTTSGANAFTPLKEGSYRITADANVDDCPDLEAVSILVGVENLNIDHPCPIVLPDDITQFYPDINPNDIVLQHVAANVESDNSIVLKPGVTLELGAELFLDDQNGEPEEEENINFIEQTAYNEYREITGKTRNYFDDNGRALQTQTANLAEGVILANETIYDALGRAVISTLPAPVTTIESSGCVTRTEDGPTVTKIAFEYDPDFVTATINNVSTPYDYQHFDLNNELTPVAIDNNQEGSLGWYYSANNGTASDPRMNEEFVPETQFPYSRTLYYHDGSGDVKGATKPGNTFKAGSGLLAISQKEPVTSSDTELNNYLTMRRDNFGFAIPASIDGEYFKTTVTDEMGKKSVVYIDKTEKSIISLYLGPTTTPITRSYQFYDVTGRLLVSVSPNGMNQYNATGTWPNVTTNFDLIDKTRYFYNAKGLLSATEEKIAGQAGDGISRTEFIYRQDGKIRFLQNAEQRKTGPKRYSYTNYDRSGRPIEWGEFYGTSSPDFNTLATHELLENTEPGGGLNSSMGQIHSRTTTVYDVVDAGLPDESRQQRFVFGSVSYSFKEEFDDEALNPDKLKTIIKTWYSYDESGRVEWMLQDIDDLGVKTIDYRFGKTGAVQDVIYQKGVVNAEPTKTEQFVHHYEYDINGRLVKAFTSREDPNYDVKGNLLNPEMLELQASYEYYLHGPLKRVELANKLQGIDYVYTVDGALKGINHSDPSKDPGNDGGENSSFRKDAFGMTLDYFDGDYTGDYQNPGMSIVGLSGINNQYTGLIKAQRWHSPVEPDNQVSYAYKYDQRNQFTDANWGTISGSTFTPNALNSYYEAIDGYDANGNIHSLVRKSSDNLLNSDDANITIADLTYNYKAFTNTLESIMQGAELFRSYEYDDLGRMAEETIDGKTRLVEYDVTGKVVQVKAQENSTPRVKFTYDERGFRLSKISFNETGDPMRRTWFVRDVSGNVVSTYEEDLNGGLPAEIVEYPVYGSGRVGVYSADDGTTQYEVTDHLGNVRAVIGLPIEAEYLATMESELTSREVNEYGFQMHGIAQVPTYVNSTPEQVVVDSKTFTVENPNEAVRLNNRPGGVSAPNAVGTGIMLAVHPGDVIEADVLAKYANFNNADNNLVTGLAAFLTSLFPNAPVVDGAPIFNVVNRPDFATLPVWNKLDDDQPQAFLNYLLFDNNNVLVRYDFVQVTSAAEITATPETHLHEHLVFEPIEIKKGGYIYIYVSNLTDQNMDVYFDDLRVKHSYSDIVAGGDYYPFGLAIKDRQVYRSPYRYGYQGTFSEKDEETGWNHFELREYDPVVGRWTITDPAGVGYSPYIGMSNNPVNLTDPRGDCPNGECPDNPKYDDRAQSKESGIWWRYNGTEWEMFAGLPQVTITPEIHLKNEYGALGVWFTDVNSNYHNPMLQDADDVEKLNLGIIAAAGGGMVLEYLPAAYYSVSAYASEGLAAANVASTKAYIATEVWLTNVFRRAAYRGAQKLTPVLLASPQGTKALSWGISVFREMTWFGTKGQVQLQPITRAVQLQNPNTVGKAIDKVVTFPEKVIDYFDDQK